MTSLILTQDDFNYNQFNKRIFDLDIPFECLSDDSADNEESES